VQFNYVKKNCTKNWTECSLAQHRFPIRFVSSVCLLVRVTMVDKKQGCHLLFASHIGHNVIWREENSLTSLFQVFRIISASSSDSPPAPFSVVVLCFVLGGSKSNPVSQWQDESFLIVNRKVLLDATVCRHLFTAESLYMFRASQHLSSGVLNTVSTISGISYDTVTASSFHRPDQATVEGSSGDSIKTYTRGSRYSF